MEKLKQGNSTIVGENGAYKQDRMAPEGLSVGLEILVVFQVAYTCIILTYSHSFLRSCLFLEAPGVFEDAV